MITLAQLPAPPAGKTGWPWTEAPNAAIRPGCATITVVTPSYNQSAYLEETIRSVLLQGYPRLEYVVIDGGSTDESVAILRRYSDWITHWSSERDRGQVDAIVRGLSRSHGEIFNWINSDDVLLPGALATVDRLMQEADIVAGACINFTAGGSEMLIQTQQLDARSLLRGDSATIFHQPAVWLRRELLIAAGGIDDTLHYVFDWELLVRALACAPRIAYTDVPLARFRLHADSKTVKTAAAFELERRHAARLLVDRIPNGNVRTAARLLARRQRWWQVLARLRQRHGDTPRTARMILGSALRDPRVRLSRLTLGSLRRCLFGAA